MVDRCISDGIDFAPLFYQFDPSISTFIRINGRPINGNAYNAPHKSGKNRMFTICAMPGTDVFWVVLDSVCVFWVEEGREIVESDGLNIVNVHKPMRCTKPGVYSWPCAKLPNRTLHVYDDDIFTEEVPGIYNKQTGLCMLGIVIPTEFMERMEEDDLKLELI